MRASDFDWLIDKTYDGANVLRGIADIITIDIMPLVNGKFMVIVLIDGVTYLHGDDRGVYVWDRQDEAKQAAIEKATSLTATIR